MMKSWVLNVPNRGWSEKDLVMLVAMSELL